MGKLISRQVDEKIELVAEWKALIRRDKVSQVATPRPQYEKRGEREAARMNMLLRQGGFCASCAKTPRRKAERLRSGAGWWGGKINLRKLRKFP